MLQRPKPLWSSSLPTPFLLGLGLPISGNKKNMLLIIVTILLHAKLDAKLGLQRKKSGCNSIPSLT